jgi:hypothetical protein
MVLRNVTVCALVTTLAVAPNVFAQVNVVSSEEMQSAVVAATQSRQKNIARVNSFLSTSKAEKAMHSARMDVKLVKNAVSSLNDEELARLAARADKADTDFAAGRMSDRDLLWILVGIAALILIIVAVR